MTPAGALAPPVRVALVRHGQEDGEFGVGDPPLSTAGTRQAREACRDIGRRRWHKLVASPAARTRQTAEIIAAGLGLTVSVDPVFEELRAPAGVSRREWQRRVLDSRWEDLPAGLREWRDRVFDRVAGFAADTIVVTHFGVINAVVSRALGSAQFFVFPPRTGSITRLAVNGRWVVVDELGARKDVGAGASELAAAYFLK